MFVPASLLAALFVPLQASLLVSKEPGCTAMTVGMDCPVSYVFYNAGNDTMENVHMNDDWGLNIAALASVKGSPAAQFVRLQPHEIAYHSYIIQPKGIEHGDKLFELITQPAAVHYKLNNVDRIVYSSSVMNMTRATNLRHVLSDKWYEKFVSSKLQYWLVFATLVGAPTSFALFFHFNMDSKYPMQKT